MKSAGLFWALHYTELRSCVKVDLAGLGSPSLINLKQHRKRKEEKKKERKKKKKEKKKALDCLGNWVKVELAVPGSPSPSLSLSEHEVKVSPILGTIRAQEL